MLGRRRNRDAKRKRADQAARGMQGNQAIHRDRNSQPVEGSLSDRGNRVLAPFDPKQEVIEATFVARMVGDTCAPPDVRVLAGYVGLSSRGPGWWRIYLTLELDDWVDIYHRDILYAEEAGDQKLSGRVLWVRKDAQVWHQTISSRQVVAQDLLQGNLARRYLPRTVLSTVPPLQPADTYDPAIDPPSVGRHC